MQRCQCGQQKESFVIVSCPPPKTLLPPPPHHCVCTCWGWAKGAEQLRDGEDERSPALALQRLQVPALGYLNLGTFEAGLHARQPFAELCPCPALAHHSTVQGCNQAAGRACRCSCLLHAGVAAGACALGAHASPRDRAHGRDPGWEAEGEPRAGRPWFKRQPRLPPRGGAEVSPKPR